MEDTTKKMKSHRLGKKKNIFAKNIEEGSTPCGEIFLSRHITACNQTRAPGITKHVLI